ncbi:DMT family transporter [Pseudomonas sp. KNUC1026]|nr:DMT family transporter [Pseudomonas sp. KNUC1026]
MLVTALWGWSFVAIHSALQEISASSLNAYRFIFGSIAMTPFVSGALRKVPILAILQSAGVGFILFLAFTFQTSGLAYTSASNASFITGLAVVFTPVFSYLLFGEVPNKRQAAGAVLATLGLGLLTLKEFSTHIGDLLVLVCAIFTALHVVLLSKYSKNVDPLPLAYVQVLVVGLLSLAWSFLEGTLAPVRTTGVFLSLIVIGVLGTAVAYYVQTRAQVGAKASTIALILVFEPVFGGIFGYLIGGDRLTETNVVGACLILVGMVVTELDWISLKARLASSRRKQTPTA